MDKSSNIKQKSNKLMLMIYRLFLKLAFGFLILSAYIVLCDKQLNFNNGVLIFAITSSFIFAVSYLIAYYLYKLYNKNKLEVIKKDPLKTQIVLLFRFIIFGIGATLLIYGAHIANNSFWGYVLIAISLCMCEFLFNNKRITSHLSTFCENASVGVLFSAIYYSATNGLNWYLLVFVGITLVLIFLQELFYHFTNIKKHNLEELTQKELIKIRIQYFVRNCLLYIALYGGIVMFTLFNLYSIITSSGIAILLFQLLPLIISVVTVVILFYTTFHKESNIIVEDYNVITNEKEFYNKLKEFNSINIEKAYDYVISNMNSKKGFTRKTGEDYYFHCLNTANILIMNGEMNEDCIATALLHDCIEDMDDCSMKDIANLTNQNVAKSVSLLTKDKNINYKDDKNMKNYLDNILNDRNATLVKIADRMHNISTLNSNFSESAKSAKREETKKYFIPFTISALKVYYSDSKFLNKALEFFEKI